MKHNKKAKNQRKAQKGHLEEGKTAKPINNKKTANQRKAQAQTPLK
jgi:hypothetical protein